MAISLRTYYVYISLGYVCATVVPFFAYSLYKGSSLLTISLAKVAQFGSVGYLFYAYTNKDSTSFCISWILLLMFTTIANIGFNTAIFCIAYSTTRNEIAGFQGVAKKTFVQNFGIVFAYALFVGLTSKSKHGGLGSTLWVALSMSVINLGVAMAILALLFQEDAPYVNFEENDQGCNSKYQDAGEEDVEGLLDGDTTPKKGGLRRSIYKAPKSILNTAPQAERNLTDKKKGVEFEASQESSNSNINILITKQCPLYMNNCPLHMNNCPLDVNNCPLDVNNCPLDPNNCPLDPNNCPLDPNNCQEYQTPIHKRKPNLHEYSLRKSQPPTNNPQPTPNTARHYSCQHTPSCDLYTKFKARQDAIISLPYISIDQTLLIM